MSCSCSQRVYLVCSIMSCHAHTRHIIPRLSRTDLHVMTEYQSRCPPLSSSFLLHLQHTSVKFPHLCRTHTKPQHVLGYNDARSFWEVIARPEQRYSHSTARLPATRLPATRFLYIEYQYHLIRFNSHVSVRDQTPSI
jgi:hypothetical protein